MQFEEIQEYCLSKEGSEETQPFGPDTLVYKVGAKVFAILALSDEGYPRVNLKCRPEYALELREQYEGVNPGYHMNKKHWNTVEAPLVSTKLLQDLIDHSYELVRKNKK